MMYFERKDKTVCINVKIDPLGATFPFAFHCDSEWSAKALLFFLNKVFNERIKAVREEEYNAGLKDSRGKKDQRRDWFDAGLLLGVKK